jgi:metal-dependent amidase/aminoacylase/carboxypeptidase family protein
VALSAINALRETFREHDTIRVHPVITQGGQQVNVIPADVRMEMYVRGRSMEAILAADAKVNRALQAGALALGAQVEIETLPGYFPLINSMEMAEVFKPNAMALLGADNYATTGHRTASTDMGDLSHVMPALQAYMGGVSGVGHGSDYRISDPGLAYVTPAKALAMTAVDLLWDDAAAARDVLARYKPPLTRAEYLASQRRISRRQLFDGLKVL